MSDDASAAGVGELVYDESYGAIARSATPTEHVYFTVVTFGRWFVAFVAAAFIVFVDWVIRTALAKFPPTLEYFVISSFGLMGVVMLLLGFQALYARTQVTISPAGITMRRRGLVFGRSGSKSWRLEDLGSVEVGIMPIYYIGGSTEQYHLVLRFNTGENERFGGAFYTVASTRRAADAILESARRMTGAN